MTDFVKDSEEAKRLEALHSYEILDTPEDPIFDQITTLASSLLNMPICLVSLVDENRQWFKSRVGLSALETPRDISFCTHAIQQQEVFEVADATLDPRFRNNPLVTGEPSIRFYAGAPLRTHLGHNLGTLCVIDRKPNHLSDAQIESLKILAQQVVDKLELRKMNIDLSEANRKLEKQQELLVKKAKVQTIGELTSGICHQINNPLAIIVGHSMILKSLSASVDTQDRSLYTRELEAIEQTTLRISDILSALKTYSRDMGTNVGLHALDKILEDVVTLVKGKLNSQSINLELQIQDKLSIEVNRNQVMQVILNLINNASEAVEKSDLKKVSLKAWSDETSIYLDVIDTGPGVSDTDKAFEAFYSTKARNFGIGLSNAQSFMEENGGELILLKRKDPTTFRMKLPKVS